MTIQDILSDIHSLEEDLLHFERKYGVRSETFYAAYVSGEEPEDDNWVLDFGEWAEETLFNQLCTTCNECIKVYPHFSA